MLITLDVPDHLVQFSDANAWYCALEGWPCYEYEEEIVESQKLAAFEKLTDPEEIWRELSGSWENIFWKVGYYAVSWVYRRRRMSRRCSR